MVRHSVVVAVAAAVAAALTLGAGPAAAACKGTTQMELNECAGADFKTSDAAMNAAYGRLLKRIGPRAQQALKDAQKAWLPYRDRTCDLEALAVDGGSAQPMVRAGCLSQVTEARTRVLNGYLDCREGDLSCVGRITE